MSSTKVAKLWHPRAFLSDFWQIAINQLEYADFENYCCQAQACVKVEFGTSLSKKGVFFPFPILNLIDPEMVSKGSMYILKTI